MSNGAGGSSAEGYQQDQVDPQFYNHYYNNQNHQQTNGAPYQHYDQRQMNYNNEYHQNNQQQQPYHHQWCPPRPYYSSQDYPQAHHQQPPQAHHQQPPQAHHQQPPQSHPPQHHHQQISPQQQFYPQEQQRQPWPPVERSPPAPLDSLQMLVKENGPVNGDKRPRTSDEPTDTEGRKRRRKSDRPTRISNGSTQMAEEVAADPPAPIEPTVSTSSDAPPPPIANGGVDEAAEVSDRSTPRLEIRTDESNEAPPSQDKPSEIQTPEKIVKDESNPEPSQITPLSTPKKKGRPKGSKNIKKKEPKKPKFVLDDTDDEKKKKPLKNKKNKKKIVPKAAEPVPVAEEKHLKGPFVRISGDKETVVNSGKTEEETGKKPRSCFNDAELRSKVVGIGFSSAMAQHYDAFTLDETWVCAFCKMGSHQNCLGDLFGPYFVQTAKKKKKFEVWVHEECCVWAPGVGLVGQRLIGLQEAIFEAAQEECDECKKKGAMVGCVKRGCNKKVHFPCSETWHMDSENYVSCCPEHERVPRDQQQQKK